MPITTAVFDAYGTLFDVNGAARLAAAEPGNEALGKHWPALARDWRLKQLEYSWLRAVAERHVDFWTLTENALDWAMEVQGLQGAKLRAQLLALYRTLPAYPEAAAALASLRDRGIRTAILSNGSPAMLADAVDASALGPHLDAVLSVETVGVFKPSARVYDLVGQHFGTAPEQVLFVSSNGWDAAGAAGYGFRTVWVNRANLPQDRLWAAPAHTAPDLSRLTEVL
jgi:2-haloacid dehalogenase